jgi:ectoine hydroxylase-related dioxygenase (phytanoyl-CoA dioxygenase family)
MFAVWTEPAVVAMAEQVLGPEVLAHPQYNLRAKLPNQPETVVPWHQDLGYLERDADETFMLNFWIPLVDAPMATGALQVIPGSHRWPVLPHEKVDGYDGVREENLPAHEVVDCPLPLGGALLIQSRTMHRSVHNTSDVIRWSLDLRYCDSRKPTGRANVPGFVVRSEERPDSVMRDWRDWAALFM